MGKFGRGHVAPAQPAPSNSPNGGSSVKSPQLSLPESKPFVSLLGENVIVKTPHAIGGQHEHAATVTHVYDGDTVDVLLMPRASDPYPVQRVSRTGAICWRPRS